MHTAIDYVAAWATLGTAVGTISLAVATFRQVRKTRDLAESGEQTATATQAAVGVARDELDLLKTQAEAAQRQSVAAEEALNSSVRPLIADVPRFTMQSMPARATTEHYTMQNRPVTSPGNHERDVSNILMGYGKQSNGERSDIFLTMPVRNIGAGVAVVVAARLAPSSDDLRDVPAANGEMASVIAPRQVVRVVFRHHEPEQGWLVELLASRDKALVVEIAYADVSGRQPTASRLYLAPLQNDPDRHYTVAQVRPLVDRQLTANVTWDPRA